MHPQFLFVFMTHGFTKTGYSPQLSVIVQSPFIAVLFSSYVCRKLLRVRIQDKDLLTKLSRHPRKKGVAYGTRLQNLLLIYLLVICSLRSFFSGRMEQVVG